MSLPGGSWRLLVFPLGVLGGQGCGALGGAGAERRLRDPISCRSSSLGNPHLPGFLLPSFLQGKNGGGGDSGPLSQRSHGACVPLSRVLQPHVRGDESVLGGGGGGVEAHYRSLHSQSFSGFLEISNGDSPVCPLVGSEERLDDHYRSQGRIPPNSYSSTESEISEVHGRRESLAVQGSLLRSFHGTADIHSGYGSGIRLFTSSGCQDATIPGRLADHGFLSGRSLLGKGHGSPALSGVGDSSQFGKVELDAFLINQDRVADFPGFADAIEDRKVLNSRRIFILKGAVGEVLESSTRTPRVIDAPSFRWPTPNEGSTVSSQGESGLSE